MATEKISVVITAHGEASDLPIILGCLEHQRININGTHSTANHGVQWTLGERSTHPIETVITYDGYLQNEPKYRPIAHRIAQADLCTFVDPQGGVGHHTRAPGIEVATGEWIVLTNSDNYFVSGWLDRLVSHITPETGLIYWDCVNNLWRWTANGGGAKFPGCRLKRGHIDLTCVAVRAELAKQVKFPWRDYEADYEYISACARLCDQKNLSIVHIPEILAVHN
mgnify:CR=1 FL=1